MTPSIKLIVYPVKDLEKAKSFYGKFLGVEPYEITASTFRTRKQLPKNRDGRTHAVWVIRCA